MAARNNQVILIGYLQRRTMRMSRVFGPRGSENTLQVELNTRVPVVEGDCHRLRFNEWQSEEVRELLEIRNGNPEVRVTGALFSRRNGECYILVDSVNFVDCSAGERKRLAERLNAKRGNGG